MGWQQELKKNVCSVDELKKYFELSPTEEKKIRNVVEIHPMSVTRYYLSLMNKKDKNDPLRRMQIPSVAELDPAGMYDTSGEKENTKSVGLQHKYKQTAVILATNSCGAYCRFCFRKRLVGLPNREILKRLDVAVKYIKKHKEINNILITGGDPLILPTSMIKKFLDKLSVIKHLDFIRFGSRVPVTFPDRILMDPSLPKALENCTKKKKRVYVVTHFNHPNEITNKSKAAIAALIDHNIVVNNQTVFMKGVNDNPRVLADLQKSLVSFGVNPYYVFQCRPVKRVKHHFQVPFYRGFKIIEEAKKLMDGHSKRFNFVMSHKTGKIEILGIKGQKIYFKYHQAKNQKNLGKIFERKLNKHGTWFDDFKA